MAKPGLAILFFVSFTVIASLVILSMFIGTISLSMGESIQQLNKEILIKKQRKRARQVAKKMERMKSSTRLKTAEQVRLEATTGVASATGDLKKKSVNMINQERLLKTTLLSIFTGKEVKPVKKEERTPFRRRVVRIGGYAEKIYDKKWYKTTMVLCVLGSAVVVCIATYPKMANSPKMMLLKEVIEGVALLAFTFEFFVTMAIFKTAPWRYFWLPHNCVDFLVLLGSSGILPGGTQFWSLMRLMRLLLILKLANKLPSLRIAVGTLIRGWVSISYIFLLLMATYFLFGNVAFQLFSANDPVSSVTTLRLWMHTRSHAHTLTRSHAHTPTRSHTHLCSLSKWHFRNLHVSMITLFRVSILDNWIQVMYINMYGCDKYGYMEYADRAALCTHPVPQPSLAPSFFMVRPYVGPSHFAAGRASVCPLHFLSRNRVRVLALVPFPAAPFPPRTPSPRSATSWWPPS